MSSNAVIMEITQLLEVSEVIVFVNLPHQNVEYKLEKRKNAVRCGERGMAFSV